MDIFGGWIFSLAFVLLVILVVLLVRSVVRRRGPASVGPPPAAGSSTTASTEARTGRSRLTIAAEVAAIVGALVTIVAVLAGR
ncbi:hypothetical protein [Phytohabitans rumicis]|uniref:Uncharacterized protein n=1 Tax=Phytohabitans rumicis TaxID=1076125 RepID=A0A6V8L8S6_9ACTN|nr:hypothetical protein [Phytohabitans rumicis]GFJ91990.1 hypothetical protein Prum_056320 [Phytohabitans rumicis]